MRNSPKCLAAAALALITLSGCSNLDNELDTEVRKDYPDFTASIVGVESRAYDYTWESADEIGISGANRINVRYVTTGGDGSFKVKTADEQIYFQDEGETLFTAYYPWNELVGSSSKINADTKEQSQHKQKSLDFLWAKASGKKDSPNVNFVFAHRMVKLSLTVKPGNGMSFDEVKAASLSLGGFRHTGSFDTADGIASVDAGESVNKWTFTGGIAPVAISDADKTATYSFIFFPQKFDNPLELMAELDLPGDTGYTLRANIDFTSANSKKDNAAARNEWVASRQYNLNLTLHKTAITLNECVITPWNVVNGDDIIVD